MSDLHARFSIGQREEVSSTCALCTVWKSRGLAPRVTLWFPEQTYAQLTHALPTLPSDGRGRWLVGSKLTTAVKLRDWLRRYDAWDMVRDAETVVFGDYWKTEDWHSYLARAS